MDDTESRTAQYAAAAQELRDALDAARDGKTKTDDALARLMVAAETAVDALYEAQMG